MFNIFFKFTKERRYYTEKHLYQKVYNRTTQDQEYNINMFHCDIVLLLTISLFLSEV